MEIFWAEEICAGSCILNEEESVHCVRVLRHREGDSVCIIDGKGTMYRCTVTDASSKKVEARIDGSEPGWGSHPYNLTLAVCPTKNTDRYEWFAEKATEIGADKIVPIIGERSERKIFKTDRVKRIVLSATKQSLKSAIPQTDEPCGAMDFINACKAEPDALKLIAYCFEGDTARISIKEAVARYTGKDIIVMIGPEGDFSPAEADAAVKAGFIPVHLGSSRLRTETAAVTAAEAVYFHFM